MVACVQGMHMAFGHVRDGLHDVPCLGATNPAKNIVGYIFKMDGHSGSRRPARRPQVMEKVSVRGVVRLAAWCGIVALAVLSLSPSGPGHIWRTDLGGHTEHVLAYLLTASFIGLGYGKISGVLIGAALMPYAALLEYLQQFVQGRTSQFEDFFYSCAGIFLGVALSWTINQALRLR